MDRSKINRALAKAIAFKQCGEEGKAHDWAVHLVEMLGVAGILNDDALIARNQRLPIEP